MKEFFYEESAKVLNEKSEKFKYNTFNVASIISFGLMVFWILIVFHTYEFSVEFSVYIILDIIIVLLPLVSFLLSGILFGRYKNKFCVDYDYTLVTGSLRFSKVVNNIKRKGIITFEISQIEKLGEYGSSIYERYSLMPSINIQILTSNSSPSIDKAFYYMVVNTEGEKKLFVIECTEKFIVYTMQFTNKTILDDEFIKKLAAKRK